MFFCSKAGKKIGSIPRPIPAPIALPDPGDTRLDFEHTVPAAEPDWNALQRNRGDASYAQLAGPYGDFSVPTIAELGIKPPSTPHRGGETLALQALDCLIANKAYTATFEKPNTAPTAFSPQSTTLLSPHLHFGSLSCRELYWRVQDVVDQYNRETKGKASVPPTSLTGQLLFRDMYFGAQAPLGFHFAQTIGNSHCRFIPWHLPSTLSPDTGLATGTYAIDWAIAETWFQRWKYGLTGFPFIDALMRQLRHEGWIHHLGRHAVASFLTRGGCYIDWMRGADVFEEWLIDHEVACNIGNWQWLSCTAFYAQFHRVYSPVAFPAKWDREGSFVRRFVPELEKYPAKYIYEPWKCPIRDQKEAGCLTRDLPEPISPVSLSELAVNPLTITENVGSRVLKTYPKPMFEFAQRREICLQGMRKAYQVSLYGNDPRVLNGTWKSLFPDDAEGPTEGTRGQRRDGTKATAEQEGDKSRQRTASRNALGAGSTTGTETRNTTRRKMKTPTSSKNAKQFTESSTSNPLAAAFSNVAKTLAKPFHGTEDDLSRFETREAEDEAKQGELTAKSARKDRKNSVTEDYIDEDEGAAADTGGDSRGGDSRKGNRRKKRDRHEAYEKQREQTTLDGIIKKMRLG